MSLYDRLDPYLEPLMAAVRRAERFLGPEDDWVEDDRRILYEAAQRHLGQYHQFLTRKTHHEYVTTAHADSDAVEIALDAAGYQRNLASSRKYRNDHDGGKQWACGSFVRDRLEGDFEPSSDEGSLNDSSRIASREHGYVEQHHVYLFEAPNGATDVYAHRETSVTEGGEHITDTNQEHGAPGIVFEALDAAGIPHGERKV
jgi:hypothetical protein